MKDHLLNQARQVVGKTARTRINNQFSQQLSRLSGSKNLDKRIDIRRRLLNLTFDQVVTTCLGSDQLSTGYEGFALFRLFAFAGRYADALAVRSKALEVLAHDRSRILPRDHSRVCGICCHWLKICSEGCSICREMPVVEMNDGDKAWVIVGPKCSREDLYSLQLSTFAVVTLNRTLPSQLDSCLPIESDKIVFMNGEYGQQMVDNKTSLPFGGSRGSRESIYFKDLEHSQMMANRVSKFGTSIEVYCAENIEHLYANGSPNMLPIALATAEKIGVSDIRVLGFDLYSNASLQMTVKCSEDSFESARWALLHDPLEQREVLRLILGRNGYRSDHLLQTAINFSDLELLERVGGQLSTS